MLVHLYIRNYALIDQLELSPDGSLNIITGETGAGKSILLGAIGLLMGNRADTRVLYHPDQKCIIEGSFRISGYRIRHLFDEEDLDYGETCLVRREIAASGKSRAFINDTPVNLDTLKRIAGELMDIHSQHDSIRLGSNDYQLSIVDTFSQNDALLAAYQTDFQTYRQQKATLDRLQADAVQWRKTFEFNSFLLDELIKAQLLPDEQTDLETELTLLEHAEDIKLKLQAAEQYLDNPEQSVLDMLKSALSQLSAIGRITQQYEPLQQRMQSTLIELRDLTDEIAAVQGQLEFDDQQAERVRERLNRLYQLQTKHQVSDVEALIGIRDDLAEKVNQVENVDAELTRLNEQLAQTYSRLLASANALTESRLQVLATIETDVGQLLKALGMPNARLSIRAVSTAPGATGQDQIDFLFSANKGITPQPLKQVASGGEFSRLMLAIKYILANKRALPTIIFDEIDAGISGEIAIQMGNMIADMAHSHQIIAITHLHQIASQGTTHYFVYKDHSSAKTVSLIRKLTTDERITEIAQMIGGQNPSASALKSARELLKAKPSVRS